MKTLKPYIAYLDDGRNAYRIIVPAESPKDVRQYVQGNGDIIQIKEFAELKINVNYLANVLEKNGYGRDEIDLITRTLQRVNLDQN